MIMAKLLVVFFAIVGAIYIGNIAALSAMSLPWPVPRYDCFEMEDGSEICAVYVPTKAAKKPDVGV